MKLKSDVKFPEILPGQFVEVMIEGKSTVFLRRPLSVHDVDYEKNTLTLLVQIVGDGTKTLSELKNGDVLNIIYPLGNSFNLVKRGRVLLIGGGCGVAPLLYLSKVFLKNGIKPDILIGARSKEYLLQVEEYKKYGNVYLATEDGSEGVKGYVIHHNILWNNEIIYDKIYTCGPELMMKAVAKYARKKNIECEVSLENLMACGFGACLCCIVETKKGNVCTCTQGPVFNVNDLTWEN